MAITTASGDRAVVKTMKALEQPRMMHRPVAPVKIGIMGNNDCSEHSKVSGQSEAFFHFVHITMPNAPDDKDADQNINENGAHRGAKLAREV
jgi:hypothetical protein